MVVLRATRKLRELRHDAIDPETQSDTALGDWYVNRFVVDRRPLLLLVGSQSLLPIVIPARDVKNLPSRLPRLVGDRLSRLAVSPALIELEMGAMNPVRVAKTTDRSVLGTMVDFARMATYIIPQGNWGHADLHVLEADLGTSPCRVSRARGESFFPDRKTIEVLQERWVSSHTGFDSHNNGLPAPALRASAVNPSPRHGSCGARARARPSGFGNPGTLSEIEPLN